MKIKFEPLQKDSLTIMDVPIKSTQTLPEWYKKIPSLFKGDKTIRIMPNSRAVNSTVKKCVPFLEAMTAGYTLTLADDVLVSVNEDGIPLMRWRTDGEIITEHSIFQYDGLQWGDEFYNLVFKWGSEWIIHTPKNYSLWVTHPSNRYDLPFMNFNGFVETDKYTNAIQFPFLLKKGFEGIIERGTPIAQIIPIKRDSWQSETLEYNNFKAKINQRLLFGKIVNSYKSQFWVKKDYQ